MNKKAVTDTFEEVRGLVYSRINDFAKRLKLADRELLVSAGFLGFMQAYDTYDPKVGAFSTWVVYLVDRRIKDVMRGHFRKRPKATAPETLDANQSRRVWMRRLWLQDLSEDARTAALAVIEPPIDIDVILAGLGPATAGNMRQAVREFLKEKGWSEQRIRSAFAEVQNALQSEV